MFLCTSGTKCKEKKHKAFKTTSRIVKVSNYQLVRKQFICVLRAFCVHIALHFNGLSPVPKEAEGCTTYNGFRVMGTTGILTKGRKVNPGKYYNKLLTPLYHDCLCKHSLKNSPNHIYKNSIDIQTISKELFLLFHGGLFFKGNINEMYCKHKTCFCLNFFCEHGSVPTLLK